eukprot:1392046-Amorphochlora_amoeboformis.AAC.1
MVEGEMPPCPTPIRSGYQGQDRRRLECGYACCHLGTCLPSLLLPLSGDPMPLGSEGMMPEDWSVKGYQEPNTNNPDTS